MRKMLALLLIFALLAMSGCTDPEPVMEPGEETESEWFRTPDLGVTPPGEMPEPPEADYTIPPEPASDIPAESK